MSGDSQKCCCDGGEVTPLCEGCPGLTSARLPWMIENRLTLIAVSAAVLTVAFALWVAVHASR